MSRRSSAATAAQLRSSWCPSNGNGETICERCAPAALCAARRLPPLALPLAMPLTGVDSAIQVIDSAGTQELGRSLTSDELESLSEEQKVQVLKIAEETVKAAPDST